MGPLVIDQVGELHKRPRALLALVWFLACVRPHVGDQGEPVRERLRTLVAAVWPFSGVASDVVNQVALAGKL